MPAMPHLKLVSSLSVSPEAAGPRALRGPRARAVRPVDDRTRLMRDIAEASRRTEAALAELERWRARPPGLFETRLDSRIDASRLYANASRWFLTLTGLTMMADGKGVAWRTLVTPRLEAALSRTAAGAAEERLPQGGHLGIPVA
jgi:acyl-CoA reductase-like NAD-dependent aldehyde dehydrogenase